MTKKSGINIFFTSLIALIWLINGLFCKILHLVPRHEQIVARILGNHYSHQLTILIGVAEIIMFAWIASGLKPRFNAVVQMVIIGVMNVLEYILAPDLLLWGKLNLLFAALLIVIIYCFQFRSIKKIETQA